MAPERTQLYRLSRLELFLGLKRLFFEFGEGLRLVVAHGLRQQVARQIEGVGDQGRDHGAADHAGDEDRVLILVDDVMRQPEQRRDGAERQSRRHQQGRVHRFLLRRFIDLGHRIDADEVVFVRRKEN